MKQDLAVAGLLHDWNNVLQTVAQAAALLEEDPQWSAIGATLSACVNRGRSLAESLNEETCAFQLREVVDRAAAGSLLAVSFVPTEDCGMYGKPRAFERALANLFENSHAAGATLVSITGGAEAFDVRDNGPGIAADLLPRLFQPGASGRGSTGLGLCIVESIVHSHGGTVEALNDGSGACFRLRFPKKK